MHGRGGARLLRRRAPGRARAAVGETTRADWWSVGCILTGVGALPAPRPWLELRGLPRGTEAAQHLVLHLFPPEVGGLTAPLAPVVQPILGLLPFVQEFT